MKTGCIKEAAKLCKVVCSYGGRLLVSKVIFLWANEGCIKHLLSAGKQDGALQQMISAVRLHLMVQHLIVPIDNYVSVHKVSAYYS